MDHFERERFRDAKRGYCPKLVNTFPFCEHEAETKRSATQQATENEECIYGEGSC
jgi:hypothetical protein